ncbi:uncharacterized protein PRCAT00003021001 [Priceomyces carsonii]|uniref:uncharacterized protein n=1 Tax=Priceomyces carsonii TaxID=28549 RepID=UPI002ED85127|nr:unnamed protein product [Priceomyces carsonii]
MLLEKISYPSILRPFRLNALPCSSSLMSLNMYKSVTLSRSMHTKRPSLLFRRFYNNQKTDDDKKYENQRYDNNLRAQFINSTLKNNPNIFNSAQLAGSGLSLKTIVLIIVGTSTITMGIYVFIQLLNLRKTSKEGGTLARSVFLPLWLNFNYFYKSKYTFPNGLRYFDTDFYDYIIQEMKQLNPHSGRTDSENFIHLLKNENIRYKALEDLSMNGLVRQVIGLPLELTIDENSKFDIWIELKYPTISGPQIDLESREQENTKSSSVFAHWSIKPIITSSIIENILTQLGLNLGTLKTSDASRKVHENSSGRIHEVPITNASSASIMNGEKSYNIMFSGTLSVRDKKKFNNGTLSYEGIIDFDHLMINRGVKLLSADLIIGPTESPKECVKYKVI